MVARHYSYAALVQRQPGEEDKKITSAGNPILAINVNRIRKCDFY